MKTAIAAAAALFVLCASAPAQEIEFFLGGEVVMGPDGMILPPGALISSSGGDGEDDEDADTPRKQRLSQLRFNRTRSEILKAWSTPAPEPIEVPPAPEAAEPSPAAEPPAPVPTKVVDPTTASGAPPNVPPPSPPPNTVAGSAPNAAPNVPPVENAESAPDEPETPTPEELAAQAAAAQALAAETAERTALEAKALEVELELFRRDVTLGDWDAVQAYLAGLKRGEARAGYTQLLASLVKGPPQPNSPFRQYAEKNYFAPADIRGLAAAAPFELGDAELRQLGLLLQQCIALGNELDVVIGHFRASLALEEPAPDRRTAAKILFSGGYPLEGGEFLPSFEEASAADDRDALNLLSRHFVALDGEDPKGGHLERAWWALQAVLSADRPEDEPEADEAEPDEDAEARAAKELGYKREALQRAVDLAPRLRDELGQAWLDESFTARPERGMEILSVIGSVAASGMMELARDVDKRFKCLELQTTATDALLQAAPELAEEWQPTLSVLASNWLTEALYTRQWDQSTSRGPALQRDFYGNFFWNNNSYRYGGNMPEPITTDRMLEIRPSDGWLAHVDAGLRPQFEATVARLLLKVGEEDEAFPFIERLAHTQPDDAEELVAEFLRTWAQNHDPNSANSRTSSYMFMYGFEERANAIPLTRSKQERNLEELAELVVRLRALPLEDLDEELLASCFTSAHSSAEVYRIETIERVFGALEGLEPRTLASLVQRMRANLSTVWREPNVQKDAKTKRRQRDIQAEVLRGYEVARAVVEQALAGHAGEWSLRLAHAAVLHDENDYRQEVEPSTEFTARRRDAFARFRSAAEAYAVALADMDKEDERVDVFTTWFYASLGACDLGAVDHEKQPVEAEIAAVRAAIDALPGEAAERHRGMFANTLFTRMSSVNPAVKFRYVRSGLEIVGDHERASEAREVYEYYRDLVTEIRLETEVDGTDRVGAEQPFGLFVSLRHTREIEREAGGFSKYLVNQNNQNFSYNYGRPTEDYRDKFEEAAREALKEHFEVLSVTFEDPGVTSRAEAEYGWRVTPYAYMLLKARGPEVDRVPPLRLDLDFLDTSGYAVLPVESSPLPIDAAGDADLRPYRDLKLTQTLDERLASQGKLVLEVQASALGLVPDLDSVAAVASESFEVASVLDEGVSVVRFDDEADESAVVSERTWMVNLRAREDLDELPDEFAFAAPLVEVAEVAYQRYDDADLESVEAVVALNERYGDTAGSSLLGWFVAVTLLLLVGGAGWYYARLQREAPASAMRFRVPEQVSPFTVIGLLRDIESNNGLAVPERDELRRQIDAIERRYFDEDEVEDAESARLADLRTIAELWVRRVT